MKSIFTENVFEERMYHSQLLFNMYEWETIEMVSIELPVCF